MSSPTTPKRPNDRVTIRVGGRYRRDLDYLMGVLDVDGAKATQSYVLKQALHLWAEQVRKDNGNA